MTTTTIVHQFAIGDYVYLITDRDQSKRIVTAVIICPDNSILYELCCGKEASKHYDFEITTEKDTVMATGN